VDINMKTLILATVGLLSIGTAWADSTLADLIQNGRRVAAIELIQDGADINAAQGDGTTPLHWAVYKIDTELTGMLLAAGAEIDAVNRYGSSPLAEAVKVANTALVEMLLKSGADANAPNLDGQTALMLAARTGSVEAAELLVEHGADVNARESWRGQTALMWAAEGRFPELTEYHFGAARPVPSYRRLDGSALCGALRLCRLCQRDSCCGRGHRPADPGRSDAVDDCAR
jgi:hypothetical protein